MDLIELKRINKQYENKEKVIEDFDLNIKKGDFTVFLGPSGCGKSTLLRMIAGLEKISAGELLINGELQNDLPPKERNIAMVFQNYALYPHMSVEKNMGFGLKMRGIDKQIIKQKVAGAAKILNLTDYLDKFPGNLSGGQQQRVALGRAIVRESEIYLMDEPLSNLDAKLRAVMREEIVTLHKQMAATTIYVTHDQTEAMTMADRIIILKHGDIQQIGTPKEVYQRPQNMFVASFIGIPPMNLIPLKSHDGKYYLENAELSLKDDLNSQPLVFGIRPEDAFVDNAAPLKMQVTYIEDMGADRYVHGLVNGTKFTLRDGSNNDYQVDQEIGVGFTAQQVSFFDQVSTNRVEANLWK